MKVKVNHKRVSLPFVSLGVLSVVQEGYSVVVRTNLGELRLLPFFFCPSASVVSIWEFVSKFGCHPICPGVKLLWDGESFLEVTVPPAFKRRLCGLCGNFNGRRRDDLRMRSGQLAQTVEQFGASWKVGGPKSCSPSATSSSTSPHQRIEQPSPSSSLEHNQRRLQIQQQQQQHPNQLASSSSSSAIRKKTTVAAAATAVTPAEEPLCQRQWHIRIRAVRECSVLKAATFAQCHPQVSPVRFFK